MQLPSCLFPGLAFCSILLLSGCVVPGYPYSYPPYGTVVAPPPDSQIQQAPPPPPPPLPAVAPGVAPGVAMTGPGCPYPYVYAPSPALIAPTFFVGFGNGYWYGNSFWPYRSGCAFYGGHYYGGYGTNYWRHGYGSWQSGTYHGGNQNWQGYHGENWNR